MKLFCQIRIDRRDRAWWIIARMTSRPVASPRAWTIRACEWPPSRPRATLAVRPRAKWVPQSISSSIRSGASRTTISTTSGSHSPLPAARVSAMWFSNWSSGSSTPAIPPWA